MFRNGYGSNLGLPRYWWSMGSPCLLILKSNPNDVSLCLILAVPDARSSCFANVAMLDGSSSWCFTQKHQRHHSAQRRSHSSESSPEHSIFRLKAKDLYIHIIIYRLQGVWLVLALEIASSPGQQMTAERKSRVRCFFFTFRTWKQVTWKPSEVSYSASCKHDAACRVKGVFACAGLICVTRARRVEGPKPISQHIEKLLEDNANESTQNLYDPIKIPTSS